MSPLTAEICETLGIETSFSGKLLIYFYVYLEGIHLYKESTAALGGSSPVPWCIVLEEVAVCCLGYLLFADTNTTPGRLYYKSAKNPAEDCQDVQQLTGAITLVRNMMWVKKPLIRTNCQIFYDVGLLVSVASNMFPDDAAALQ